MSLVVIGVLLQCLFNDPLIGVSSLGELSYSCFEITGETIGFHISLTSSVLHYIKLGRYIKWEKWELQLDVFPYCFDSSCFV